MCALRISYKKAGTGWRGALKDESGKTVWVCEHRHANRDNGSWLNGASARGCAADERRRREQGKAA
jgi:hypothetical protein